jgi:anti-sigma B factor antagonist
MRDSVHPPQQDHPEFRVDVHPQREVVRVVPVGELDVATGPLLETQLRQLRDSGFGHIVLDLRELTFMDSTGIRLILAEDDFARSNGRDFSLIDGRRAIRHVMDVCAVDRHMRSTAPAPPPLRIAMLAGCAPESACTKPAATAGARVARRRADRAVNVPRAG